MELAILDELIAKGRYATRSDALRAAFRRLVREEREREVADAYRGGYGRHPQETWVGEAGLAAFPAFASAEGDAKLWTETPLGLD